MANPGPSRRLPPSSQHRLPETSASPPPMWSWKGYMQWWSVGCRAPTLCKAFVNMKARKSLGKAMVKAATKRGKRREESAEAKAEAGAASAAAMEAEAFGSKNSRAAEPARHSTASSCYYERLGEGEAAELMVMMRRRGEKKQQLGGGGGGGARRSVDGASTASKGRIIYNYNNGNLPGQLPLLRQLLAGNQFLTHLTAAPLPPPSPPSNGSDSVRPSFGLLNRDAADLRRPSCSDRVVFFL